VGGQAEAEHQQAASRARDLSVPSARQRIDQPNQVWAADITYIPMRQGFLYLIAIIDWATQRVLSWRLSNTLMAAFCVEALSEALGRFGKPDIFSTDQGAQFTSDEFAQILRDYRIEISMNGRGRYHDNIFVETLLVDREAWMGLPAPGSQRHRTEAQPCRVLRLV
jgi:transposase InsO family protein